MPTVGRFAPSPTGSLHVGNLRTAVLAWLFATEHPGGRFLVRVEDLDPVASRQELVDEHLADLAGLGLDWETPVLAQSDPAVRARHEAALDTLAASDRLYPCWCTRREVAEASAAAHGPLPEGAYPGTCATLDRAGRARRQAERPDRQPALRVRADDAEVTIEDRRHGALLGRIDDFVVRRGDGVPAYNLAVVVDDGHQGVTQVVRGDDLLLGTPRQAWLADVLGIPRPEWVHVPLVVGTDGERLAKRHGSVTRTELRDRGWTEEALLAWMGRSLGADVTAPIDLHALADRVDLARIGSDPVVFDPEAPQAS